MPQKQDKAQRRNKIAIARWLESQRGRPQYRPAPPLARSVSKVMRPLTRQYGSATATLEPHWETIMGARFSKITRPVKFSGPPDNRRLVISAPGPAGALIMASNTQIIDRLNLYLGPGFVRALTVISATSQKPAKNTPQSAKAPPRPAKLSSQDREQLRSGLEHVKDPDLKAALERLGRAVRLKNTLTDTGKTG